MMLITQERTTLNNADKKEVVIINPNIPFKSFELDEELTVTSSAYIRSVESGEIVASLQAGQKIKGLGDVIKVKPRARPTPAKG